MEIKMGLRNENEKWKLNDEHDRIEKVNGGIQNIFKLLWNKRENKS